ncbi:MAG TPA: hypothetical protein VLI44_01460, partial [Sporolactobacillaceae bacterium]|nr:hypothetical protein [Sporolactobacillaceae bacterium]
MSNSKQGDDSRSRLRRRGISALLAIALLASVASPRSIRADDDWHVVERHTNNAPPENAPAPA